MEKIASGHNVVNVGGCGVHAVNQAEGVINAEVPLISCLGLAQFRIALTASVLGGAWGKNIRGINNAAFAKHQAILLQMFAHLFKQHFGKTVALEEMAELDRCGFAGQEVQLQVSKVPHGFDVVQGIFHGWVAEVIEQLHAVNQWVRRMARLALRIITGHILLQPLLRNKFVHPFQKNLAASLALLGLVLGLVETHLIHGGNEFCAVDDGRIIADLEACSESP